MRGDRPGSVAGESFKDNVVASPDKHTADLFRETPPSCYGFKVHLPFAKSHLDQHALTKSRALREHHACDMRIGVVC